jgi:hypothetical protein
MESSGERHGYSWRADAVQQGGARDDKMMRNKTMQCFANGTFADFAHCAYIATMTVRRLGNFLCHARVAKQ